MLDCSAVGWPHITLLSYKSYFEVSKSINLLIPPCFLKVFPLQWTVPPSDLSAYSSITQQSPSSAIFSSVQFNCSLLSYSATPWTSMPDLPVHHQLPELTQTHVHWVGDAIQPSHPLWSPSPLAFNLSQNQGLFKWVSSSHQVAKVLEFQLQHQSFQWTPRTDLL